MLFHISDFDFRFAFEAELHHQFHTQPKSKHQPNALLLKQLINLAEASYLYSKKKSHKLLIRHNSGVSIWSAISKKLPGVADFFDLIHIQIGDD